MSAADLIADLTRRGIRLEAAGERLRYCPRSALTPDLLTRLKAHKAGVLALLQPTREADGMDRTDAKAVRQAALEPLEGDPLLSLDVMEALRARVRRADDPPPQRVVEPLGPDGWPMNSIDPNELTPCPKCGTLELWQSASGDLFGRTPGRWRCMKCDPPTTAQRLAELAERIRRSTNPRIYTRHNG